MIWYLIIFILLSVSLHRIFYGSLFRSRAKDVIKEMIAIELGVMETYSSKVFRQLFLIFVVSVMLFILKVIIVIKGLYITPHLIVSIFMIALIVSRLMKVLIASFKKKKKSIANIQDKTIFKTIIGILYNSIWAAYLVYFLYWLMA